MRGRDGRRRVKDEKGRRAGDERRGLQWRGGKNGGLGKERVEKGDNQGKGRERE